MDNDRYAYFSTPPCGVDLDAELPDEAVALALRGALAGAAVTRDALAALTELTIESPTLRTLVGLPPLPGLRTLTLRAPALEDLSGIERAPRLQQLYLHGVATRELGPLGALRRLALLDVARAPVSDLTPVAGLTTLRELRIERTRVTELAPLAGLVKLKELSLCNNPIEDLRPLAGLHEVLRLFLHHTRVRTIAPLAGLRSLAVLGLVACPVDDLSAVLQLPQLQAVLLAYTCVDRHHVEALRQQRPALDFDGLDRELPAPGAVRPQPAASALEIPALVEAVAAAAELTLMTCGTPPAICGLALRGAPGPAVPFAENAWGIPTGATFTEALRRVWGPLRRRAPHFTRALESEALGVALLAGPDEQSVWLGYLLPWSTGDSDSDPAPGTSLAELVERGQLSVMLGSGPGTLAHAPKRKELVTPLALRELQRVHAVLMGPSVRVGDLDTFDFLTDPDDVARFEARCGAHPDRFVTLAHREQDRAVFDLDQLDGRGDPLVRGWSSCGWELAPRATSFWEWFQMDSRLLPERALVSAISEDERSF